MNQESIREKSIESHEPHWIIGRAAFPVLATLSVLVQAGLAAAVYYERYWIALGLALVASHVMHGMLIALHEASHGLLRKNRVLNRQGLN